MNEDPRYWRDDAECRLADARLFEPPTRDQGNDEALARYRLGRAICRRCPVQSMCLDDALSNGDSGLFAGQYLEDGVPAPDPKPPGRQPKPKAEKAQRKRSAVVHVVDVHRPVESYFGPADPLVLGALLDALFPPVAKRGKAHCKDVA